MTPFRKALFDTTFDEFITKRVASVLWVINVCLIFLSAVLAFIFSMMNATRYFNWEEFGDAWLWMAIGFIGVPIGTFLWLIISRLGYEAFVAVVAVAENTMSMRARPAEPNQPKPTEVTKPAKKESVPEEYVAPVLRANEAKLTAADMNLLMSDFDISPNDFARDVLGVADHKLWVKASKPDLKPWIRLGMPDFELWLRNRAK